MGDGGVAAFLPLVLVTLPPRICTALVDDLVGSCSLWRDHTLGKDYQFLLAHLASAEHFPSNAWGIFQKSTHQPALGLKRSFTHLPRTTDSQSETNCWPDRNLAPDWPP